MLMLKSTHDRIVEAKDADWDAEFYRAEALAVSVKKLSARNDTQARSISSLIQQNDELLARLAVFTAPRARNAKGHFLPVKGAEA